MSTTVTDGGWTAHFGIPTILYGPGSLEEAHSVDEKIEASELQTYSDVLYQFLNHWYDRLRNKIVYKNKGNGHERPLPISICYFFRERRIRFIQFATFRYNWHT